MTFTTAGGLGESETAGLVMNIVPKSGGNTMHGSFFASGTGEQAAVRQPDAGVEGSGRDGGDAADEGLRRLGDARRSDRDGSRCGISSTAHTGGSTKESANVYYNLNAGDPDAVAVRARLQPAASTPTGRSRTPAAASRGR